MKWKIYENEPTACRKNYTKKIWAEISKDWDGSHILYIRHTTDDDDICLCVEVFNDEAKAKKYADKFVRDMQKEFNKVVI